MGTKINIPWKESSIRNLWWGRTLNVDTWELTFPNWAVVKGKISIPTGEDQKALKDYWDAVNKAK